MPFLKVEDGKIHYQGFGAGFPILLFAPGGMWSEAAKWQGSAVWNDWTKVLAKDYRVIAMDQRNAGQSRTTIEADHGWHSYATDHLALMDHLGIDRFHTLGGCIGSSFCLKLCEMAPDRISATVLQNPIGLNPEAPTNFPDGFAKWCAERRRERPELNQAAMEGLGRNLWGGDFVFSVSRDFVRQCRTPALVLPGNDVPHPRIIGMEVADLLPGSERLIDWKGPDHIDEQRERVLSFLQKHTP